MLQPNPRRSGLLDLMIVIAAVAIGLWIMPEGTVITFQHLREFWATHGWSRLVIYWVGLSVTVVQPIAAVGTVTLLALSYRGCSLTRRLTTSPGASACLAATIAMLIAGPFSFATTRINLVPGLPISVRSQVYLGHALTFEKAECGIAVASAWVALAIGRRCRLGPGATDRLGVLAGLYWIATIPSTWLVKLF